MMAAVGRVRVLPDELINRIAAGEVVERPASVVKELVENALDAGSGRIRVELAAGGRRLVRVTDDGCGMEEDDALLALERHATSKLGDDGDLERIATLGFRGEALPSIAAVSRFELVTSADPGRGGTRIVVEGGRIVAVEPVARARGTTVEVRDLFFNVPARRKFLRSAETELRHAVELVESEALAAPGSGFALVHGGRSLLEAPPAADRLARFADVGRRRLEGDPRRVVEERGALTVECIAGRGRGGAAVRIVTVVNGRPVRDRLLMAAARRPLRAAGDTLSGGLLALWIDMPPEAVDVNVHPAKAEVRFAAAGAVFAAVEAAVARALRAGAGEVPVRSLGVAGGAGSGGPAPPGSVPEAVRPLFSHPVYGDGSPGSAGFAGTLREKAAPAWGPPAPRPSGARPRTGDTPFGRLIGQYRNSFLLVEGEAGLLIVDQHVAHERVLYERFLARLEEGRPVSQGLLDPVLVELEPALAGAFDAIRPLLADAGVEADRFGEATVRVTALPPELGPDGVEGLLRELLDHATAEGGRPDTVGDAARHELAASLACRGAIKVNHPLGPEEQRRLLEELARTGDPYRCPHGRPIVLTLAQDEMERRLGRR